MANAQNIIDEASKHVGYAEGPKKTNMFGKWYGADRQPWCAMFVSYVLNHAGAGSLISGAQTRKGFASCGAGIKFFKKKNGWHSVKDSQKGDLAFFDWDKDQVQDHVGIIVKNDKKNKRVMTIEGNTNDGNSSNGGHCVKQWRTYTYIMGVGRPAYDPEPKPIPVPVVEAVDKPQPESAI